ncbi:hypothetical protein PLANPX_4753 [Lacipirellula parvula]|uniref:Recombinase domain-containing protein n=2 Tax=Lacipirellula parvula TaxID=2650471 RepID=A0A5K7XJB9_9BACT|nr:hypothetical protein PLANPX_4753 [Lacipirellula parvula]
MAAARRGEIKVVLFENLSRLARDVGLTINTLKELVYRHKVRIISIDDGIDTQTNQQWEYITVILGVQNEQYLKMLAKFVHRGQEGVVLDGLCVGDYCFGYGSEPLADQIDRRGKNSKPKKKYVIVPEHAAWVVCIFQWFTVERRSLRWITRELNKNNAPKDHRSSTPKWHHQQLRGVLTNRKYIGEWSWGRRKNERDPISGAIRQVDRSPVEYEKWHRTLPGLKIIDEEAFVQAQALLAESASALAAVRQTDANSRKQKGHLNGTTSQASERWPRHLLSGLIVCGECGRNFQVSGNMSRYMACPGYAVGECSCKTTLRRELAENLLLNEITNRLLADPLVVEGLLDSAAEAWREITATGPANTLAVEQKLGDVKRRIEKLMNLCETEDSPDLKKRLIARCAERDALQQKLAQLSTASCISVAPPTEEWIISQLSDMRELISSKGPAAHAALRALVDGRIVAYEVKTPGRSRFYHRLKFDVQLYNVLSSTISANLVFKELEGCKVELDVREPPQYEALAEQIKVDFDAGLSIAEIKTKHGCSYTVIDKAMKHWHEINGVSRPDGRSLRGRLPKQRASDQLLEQVMELWGLDLPVREIAARLECGLETVRAAVVTWHESRGLPVPDGRVRRKSIRLKRENDIP